MKPRSILAAAMWITMPVGFATAPASMAQTTSVQPSDLAAGLKAYDEYKYADAVRILKPLAEQGDGEAQFKLALIYQIGSADVKSSSDLFVGYIREAEQQGHIGARLTLASSYLSGFHVEKDGPKGITMIQSVLNRSDISQAHRAQALRAKAAAHRHGQGVEISPSKSLSYHKKAYAAEADKFTLESIVDLLDRGVGGGFEEEAYWYRELASLGNSKAFTKVRADADAGNAHSQYVIANTYFGDLSDGVRYARNIGEIERNEQLSRAYYERAAKGGIGDAAVELSGGFETGPPTAEMDAKASDWIKKAPTMEFLDGENRLRAQINLGDAYFTGRESLNIARDLTNAETLYRAAGHGDGLNELAKAYLYAKGTPEDIPKGVALLKEGSAAGHAKSQFNLALTYVFGKGVEPSYDKALELFDLSVKNGFVRAKQYADDLRLLGKLPDVTPDQLVG